MISIIAAIGKNNELGLANKLLWQMPADMKHFRDTTRGHTVVMGRKTFESIGRPLPNRRNIVITRDTKYKPTDVEVFHSIEEALENFKNSEEQIFNIGGGEMYKQGIKHADRLYITQIDVTGVADTFFPEIGPEWKEVSKETHQADRENPFPYTFYIYEKI